MANSTTFAYVNDYLVMSSFSMNPYNVSHNQIYFEASEVTN